ncbi:MAG: peptidylprolyl isomerase, partial [Alphaproteobacteria bacterium]|nr:peptidylprolyl isomerase [Alphaproteobacteria bacterium]
MLRSMRESTQGWPARILLVLIIAAFAFWGVQGIGQGSAPPVAKVGESRISQQEFLLAFQNEVSFRARSTEGEYTTQNAIEEGLDRQVLERLIVATALDEHAEELGLRASDQMVNNFILEVPAFQDTQGRFDQFTYQQQLDRLQQSHQQFFEERRQDIERQHLAQTIVSGVDTPEPMTQAILNYSLERRTADYFTISYADMTAIQTPTEPEIRAYYEANPGEFTAPEYRGLTFLTIRVPQVLSRVEVDEERIRQEYEIRKAEFGDP